MTEYGIFVKTIELKQRLADATADEVSEGLAGGLGNYLKNLPKMLESFEGGGWKTVSHNLTRIDRHLVLSLLISRGS